MVRIANPLYDTVFKHLMENQEVARGLISQLLGLEIVELVMQPQELTDYHADSPVPEKGSVRIFRIDFSAIVKSADGKEHRVLIELQKGFADGVVERFRQYLGKHYSSPAGQLAPVPIIAIYLLGFWLNKDLPAVTKVRREYLDGVSGMALPGSAREQFIEQLTHDAVVVQIPGVGSLQGSTDLESALRLFDQSHRAENPHFLLHSDDDLSAAPEWLQKMVRLLQNAAADESVRKQMSVEDEARDLAAKLSRLKEVEQQVEEERRLKEEERRMKEEFQAKLAAAELRLKQLGHAD